MKTEFYVIRMRVPNPPQWLYYNDPVGYPGETVPFERAKHYADLPSTEPDMKRHTEAGDVAYVHPVGKYDNHDELMLGEAVAHNLPAPTAELLHAAGPKAFIIALADSFPCLRGKVEGAGFTAETWDVNKWVKYSGPWSHGERCAAMFVAMVWNYGDGKAKRWKFDAIDAVSVWDSTNRAAFIAWAKKPVWP